MVLFPPPLATIRGRISNVKGNTFTVKTEAATTSPQVSKIYEVAISKDTAISITSGDIRKSISLTAADLKENNMVIVFTEDNPNQTQIKALQIIILSSQ